MTWDGGTTWDSGTTWDQSLSVPPPPPVPPHQVWPNIPGLIPDIRARQAWLTLGDQSLSLCDRTAGYVCTELNLGYPGVREVVDNWPDRHGTQDRTSLWSSRAVTATVAAIMPKAAKHRDTIARLFGPYIQPGVRPLLHYLADDPDRPGDERVVTLRATDFSHPFNGEVVSTINLGWVAPDPIIYSAQGKTATSWPAGVRTGGLVFPTDRDQPNGPAGVRTYPADGMPFRFASATGSGFSTNLETDGDVDVYPMLRIYGRITAPQVSIINYFPDGQTTTGVVGFRSSYTVDVGPRYVDIDTAARTVTADDGTPLESQVATWGQSWPVIAATATQNILTLTGTTPDGIAQVVAAWRDGWNEP